jgi:hypothetical protein
MSKICIIILILLTSCYKKSFIYKESYEKYSTIKIKYIFVSNGKRSSFISEYKNDLIDSLSNLFRSEIGRYGVNFDSIVNESTKNVWKSKKERSFSRHKDIDTNYIKSLFNQNDNTIYLVPIINYLDDRTYKPTFGTDYCVSLTISVFLIQNGCIIYSMQDWHTTDPIFYVTEKEREEQEKEINFKAVWEKTVQEVMQPYMDRLK